MDYVAFCRNYSEATGLPVDLLLAGKPVYSALGERMNLPPSADFDLFPMGRNPSFCSMPGGILYGRVRVEGTDYDVILGPAFSLPVTEELVRQYMRGAFIPAEETGRVTEILSSLPLTGHLALAKHMRFIYGCLNGKETDVRRLYEGTEIPPDANRRNTLQRMDDLDAGDLHSTYLFEIGLYECVKSGLPERLQSYLQTNARTLREGRLADNALRHAKNLFIIAAARTGIIGAIPGGMDAEKAYQLTEYYIRECEKLASLEAINALQYAMVLDFCRRTGESKIPQGISADTFACMNFIRSNVNRPLSLQDVAAHIHRSVSYVSKRFAAELGFSVNTFIVSCRLEEAGSLLVYTEKTLAEISAYLCFSSQSYFQNVFRKKYGVTPMQYRKQQRRVQ